MSHVSLNLAAVREKIRIARLKRPVTCSQYKALQYREPRLVAVSKTKPKELVIEAYKCGQRHFGENYVQEIVEKAFDEEILTACPEIKWHFIGHLQRNKVNKLLSIPNLFVVETVDSEKLADALNSGWEKSIGKGLPKLNVFVQVNTSGEEAKSGCKPDEACNLVKYARDNCQNLNVIGLMTIGKYDNRHSGNTINPDFECLLHCTFKVCRDLGIDLESFDISMGMSGDYEHAIVLNYENNLRIMKINRYKKVNRTLKFYANHFGFRKPYQVLLDGTICVAALKHKINIHEQFTKYLDGNAKLLTTQCIIKEVERLGPNTSKALYVLKNFGQHQCGHDEKAVPASDCIVHMIESGADSRYVVATQDRELQGKCRRIPGVPLLYFHMRVPTLEAPSEASHRAVIAKASVDAHVRTREKDDSSREVEPSNKKKKRKIKGGPNPLSCKKKKKKSVNTEERGKNVGVKKRRKNHCPRLVKRIKNELSSTGNLKRDSTPI